MTAEDNAMGAASGAGSAVERRGAPAGAAAGAALSVGATLRAARDAAGLSEDAVAQQLKLAPRQVRAIEEDDYARLPGRTFVRGFVRNYARLVHLDADAVVAALPTGEATSPLERLTYTPSSRPMGEMPPESRRRGGGTARWLIPLVLLAVVAVAAYYEFWRPSAPAPAPATPDGVMPPPAPRTTTPTGPAATPLPNPLEAPKSEAAPSPVAVGAGEVTPTGPAKGTEAPATPVLTASAPATYTPVPPPPIAAPATTSDASAPAAPPAAEPRAAAAEAPLVLSFSGTSWVQVKDASGAVVVAQTAASGATIPVSGSAPFALVIGSADQVRVKFRGQPIELTPHVYHNVARLTLK